MKKTSIQRVEGFYPRPLQFLRVGHDWVTSLSLFTFMHWRRKWQPTPVFLPGESQEQRSLVVYGVAQSRTWLKWCSSSSSSSSPSVLRGETEGFGSEHRAQGFIKNTTEPHSPGRWESKGPEICLLWPLWTSVSQPLFLQRGVVIFPWVLNNS